MSPPPDSQPSDEANPTPVDGGTLLPPASPAESAQCTLQGLSSTDSSLIADTSHVQHLINHGADVNAPDNNGWTPLHTAAYHGQEEIVRILLAAHANVNARNKSEETPLHLAAKWPQDRVVEALLTGGADLSARNKRGRTPAHVAALFNRHAILDRLLNAGADVNAEDGELQTPLHLAVRANCPVEPELVKTLIRHNANLERADVRGHTPLHFLPCAQDWLHWAAYEGRESLMQVLLCKPGVRPDCYSEEGLTPLHLAAHVNNTNMVTMLLNAGAKVNAPSQLPQKTAGKDSGTYGIPLPGAPGSITAGISISSQLKAYGSSKLPPGELTALHIAAERGSAELVRVLVAAGAKVNIQGDRGMPPLHVAVWEGNTAAVVSLLAAKASVSLKSKAGGFTSVHCACLSSRATLELLALLLDNGGAAVIEERCQEGWTALHLACQSAPPGIVELLLSRGARPTAKGKNGRTAADCATKRPEILQLLHVYTGGKVPLPVGMGLPSMGGSAATTNGVLAPNGSSAAAGGGPGGGAAVAGRGGSSSGSRGGRSGGRGGPAAASSSSSGSQAGLLPGTAAMLEPLESVEATLAALLADMGGALCSLQAGAVFGAGACSVDPVGHCIRPLDKRLVMLCTLGCQFSFHLQCWKSAREVLKERWPNFNGSLAAEGRYCCFAPGCPGYIREQAICDGSQMQSFNQSRLYLMPPEVYDSLPAQAKPVGGGMPPQPGGSEGYGGLGCLAVGQQHSGPVQPPLPASSGNTSGSLSSLAALGPSLTLAQAMMQAATAVGNMVGGPGKLGASQLAAALAATGGLPALLAGNGPQVPQAMSAREAAAIAAQTLGVSFGVSGGCSGTNPSSCVVEELGGGDDVDENSEEGTASKSPGGSSPSPSSARGGATTRGGCGSSSSSIGIINGSSCSSGPRKQGGSGSIAGAGSGAGGMPPSRRGAKGSGGKSLGGKSSVAPPISSAAAAEMLQQLQGLQQAVAAVQSAVGAGVQSMGLSMGSGGGPAASAAAAAGGGLDGAAIGTAASAAAEVAAAAVPKGSSSGRSAGEQLQQQQQSQQQPTILEPPPEVLLPPRELPPAGPVSSCGDDEDDSSNLSYGGESLHDVAPVPPPRRPCQPMPPMPRRSAQPLTGLPYENGRQLLSPQLATPPPATSLLTPGVQSLVAPSAAVPCSATAPLQRQLDASRAPILVGPHLQLSSQGGSVTMAPVPAPVKVQSATSLTDSEKGGSHATANGCVAAAAVTSHENWSCVDGTSSSGTGTSSGTHSPPSRGANSAVGGGIGANTAPAATAAAKHEPTPSLTANGPTTYGARVNLSTSSLSIGLVRGSPLAAAAAAAAAAAGRGCASSGGSGGPSLPGLTITRATGSKASAAAMQGVPALHHHAGSYEPGGYARAVCPGLRPGVHRVTLSAGRSAHLQQPVASPDDLQGAAPPTSSGGIDDGMSTDVAFAADAAASAAVPAASAVVSADRGVVSVPQEREPQGDGEGAPASGAMMLSPDGAATECPAVAGKGPMVEPAAAADEKMGSHGPGASPSAAEEQVGATAAATVKGMLQDADIIVAALHSLRQDSSAGAPFGAPCGVGDAAAGSADHAAASACCRHLLLESGDIPLLAGTPGMLEAWLSAHVGMHGRLAAYRILAPQAAVAVSLESEVVAAAAAASLRGRSNLLVAPLTVAPLVKFPDDDVLAASAQQVARASCPPGDRSWMIRMMELWERLHALPPVVRGD